jgi:hypothetical protein
MLSPDSKGISALTEMPFQFQEILKQPLGYSVHSPKTFHEDSKSICNEKKGFSYLRELVLSVQGSFLCQNKGVHPRAPWQSRESPFALPSR